jgi:type IV secretory pathway component VirB8
MRNDAATITILILIVVILVLVLVIFIAEFVPVAESEPVTILVAASVAVVEPESVAGTRSGKLVERWLSQFLCRTKR